LRIHLKEIDYGLSHILAFDLSGAVAREVIEFYGEDTNAHPVGSGPYRLKHYARSSKIVLEANPGYRENIWRYRRVTRQVRREVTSWAFEIGLAFFESEPWLCVSSMMLISGTVADGDELHASAGSGARR